MFNKVLLRDAINRFIPRKENKGVNRYYYGVDDKLPKEIIELIASNPTALRCVFKIAEYIVANGFTDETLNKKLVTKDKTAEKLLFETAIQYAIFECVCWHVSRKTTNEVGSVDIHPFEMVRRKPNGNLDYNPTLLSGDEKNNWKEYPAFSKDGRVKAGYIGEIYYRWNKTPIAFNHPIPSWFAGEHTIKTGSELALMDLELVENGFMPSAILTMIGNIDNIQKDENGYTQKDYLDTLLEKWTSKSKDVVTGKSKRHSIMVTSAETKEQIPDLQTFAIDEIISGSIEKKEAVDKDTCRIFNVNPVILNWDAQTFFSNGDAIKNIKASMADSVMVAQNLIQDSFKDVYPEFDWKLSTLNPYKSVVEKTENQKILDTLNSLSPLLASEIVRNMPKDKLLSLVGIEIPAEIPENVNQ